MIGACLLVWGGVSYGCSIFAIDWLNQFQIGRLPLGFWFAQQGAIYTFVVLIFVYAWGMDRLDRGYHLGESQHRRERQQGRIEVEDLSSGTVGDTSGQAGEGHRR